MPSYPNSLGDEFVGWSMQLDAKLETLWGECFYCGVPIDEDTVLCPGCSAPRRFREPPISSLISETKKARLIDNPFVTKLGNEILWTTSPARRPEGLTDANYGETIFPVSNLEIGFEHLRNSLGQMFLKPVEWLTQMFTDAKF